MKYFFLFLFFSLSSSFLFSNEIQGRVLIRSHYNYSQNRQIERERQGNGESVVLFSSERPLGDEVSFFQEEATKENILDYNGENIIRRAEIIFFGALTFVSFFGWLTISGYNAIMGSETFGTLKRYQFLTLFIGSGVVGLSVSLSDLFLRLKPYLKQVEIY